MMLTIAKGLVIAFGFLFIFCGILMVVKPELARSILRKAASTNLINYGELLIRMVPAIALIYYADYAKMSLPFSVMGWIMIGTSVVLILTPRRYHYAYSQKAADILKPLYFQWIGPISMGIGIAILYNANLL